MIKKLLYLLFALLVPAVSATTVILVSDVQADCITAENIASIFNDSKIIKTPWGVYNESIAEEILNLNPDKVIIIGGPMAVPDEYVEVLKNNSINVERIWGKDRYETNKIVVEKFKNYLKLKKKIIVVPGNADVPVNVSNDCIVVLTNGKNITVNITEFKPVEVQIIETPGVNITKIKYTLRNHGIKVRVQAIPKDILKVVVENKIRHLKLKIELLKRYGIDTKDLEEKLNEIENLVNQGKYDEAYKLAIQLQYMTMVKTKNHIMHNISKMRYIMNNMTKIKHEVMPIVHGHGKILIESNNSEKNVNANVVINGSSNKLLKNVSVNIHIQ